MNVCAIIVGAGKGERLDAETPKSIVKLGDKPLVRWCVEAMAAVETITSIVVLAPSGYEQQIEDILQGIDRPVIVKTGGETRTDSVRIGVKSVAKSCNIVAIHDAARPLIKPSHILRVIIAAAEHGAAALATPVNDTLKRVEGECIISTQPRDNLWAVQTPQVFQRELLERALELLSQGVFLSDDCALLERIGESVRVVRGDATNIKITYPEDIIIAEAIKERLKG